MADQLTIARIVQTCEAFPSQWNAWTPDGQYLYLRYRSGRGSVDAFDNPDPATWGDWAQGNIARFGEGWNLRSYDPVISNDGEISLEEFCEQAGLLLAPDLVRIPYDQYQRELLPASEGDDADQRLFRSEQQGAAARGQEQHDR